MVKVVFKKYGKKKKYRIVRKPKRRKSPFEQIKGYCKIAIFIIVAVFVFTIMKVNTAFNNLTHVQIGSTRSELMISDEAYEAQNRYSIENIAIFGKDVEDDDGYNRSDTIMILSMNNSESKISLTSIQRDTYVYIPEYGMNKINTAYFFGDAALAVQTLNATLDMDIEYYVSVDMKALVDIVDALGGIKLDITETELSEFNLFMDDINYTFGEPYSAKIGSAGTYLCDGRQAMVYSRIRKIGNSDFDRTARQRIVLSKIYEKAKSNFSLGTLFDILDAMSEHIETNIPKGKIISMAVKVLKSKNGFETYSLCDEEYIRSAYVNGMQCLIPYWLNDMAEDLHTKIYGTDFEYVPSEQLKSYSQKIKNLVYNYGITLEKIYTGDTL